MTTRTAQSTLDALAAGLTTVAVTGTNGKTTTASMVATIAQQSGRPAALVTTLGMWVGDEQIADDGSMPSFVRTMKRARAAGATTVALEVTSRALEGGFAQRWPPHVAVLTNLTPDHLDRHGTPERYLAAKAQLFVHLRESGSAVLNAADDASRLLAEVLRPDVTLRHFLPKAPPAMGPRQVPIDLGVARVEHDARGIRLALSASPLAERLGLSLSLGTPGTFNADNALAAALAADAAGFSPRQIRDGLSGFEPVAGRFEVVAETPLCVVDFGHSPDALRRALECARELAETRSGRLGCVFGCGGERDRDKRASMGELADRLADVVWLTTDNPRGEPPAAIAAAVRSGVRGQSDFREEPDRERAIEQAVTWSGPDDVVVVLGRGPERFQQIGERRIELSDRAAVRAALLGRKRV